MNDFYEEPKHLNMKKIILLIVIAGIIFLSIILLIAKHISKPKNTDSPIPLESTATSNIFYSENKEESIELSNSYKMTQSYSNPNYIIDLHSDNNLNIFVSKHDTIQMHSLSEVTEADKTVFVNNFEGYSNLSDTKELSVNNNPGFTYSFHYLDKNLHQSYYIQITWLQVGKKYYTFDIEFPLDDLSFNTNVTSDVLANFKILNNETNKNT